jgi:predicted DCC family thiol-disulfide oxidoreductase YuxK
MITDRQHSILLFDGVCKFCHASVQFVIKRDVNDRFIFCTIQSDKGQELVKQHGLQDSGLTSMILLDRGKVFRKSSAALRIAKQLKAPWPLLYGFIIVPTFIRNIIYDFIGNHRYQWFGKFDQCMIPDDETRKKFME